MICHNNSPKNPMMMKQQLIMMRILSIHSDIISSILCKINYCFFKKSFKITSRTIKDPNNCNLSQHHPSHLQRGCTTTNNNHHHSHLKNPSMHNKTCNLWRCRISLLLISDAKSNKTILASRRTHLN